MSYLDCLPVLSYDDDNESDAGGVQHAGVTESPAAAKASSAAGDGLTRGGGGPAQSEASPSSVLEAPGATTAPGGRADDELPEPPAPRDVVDGAPVPSPTPAQRPGVATPQQPFSDRNSSNNAYATAVPGACPATKSSASQSASSNKHTTQLATRTPSATITTSTGQSDTTTTHDADPDREISKTAVANAPTNEHDNNGNDDDDGEDLAAFDPASLPPGDFEQRRRRAVFTAMLLLLERGARDGRELSRLAAAMSGEELLGVAEERALAGKCGNPLCPKPHTVQSTPRRRWDPAVGPVELPPPSHFCGVDCEAATQAYAAQLGDPMERLKPSVRQVMAVSHTARRPGMEDVAAQGGGVATMMSEVRERDAGAAAQEAEAGGRALDARAAGQQGAGAGQQGPAGQGDWRAVDGYVPVGKQDRAKAGAKARDRGGGGLKSSLKKGAGAGKGVVGVKEQQGGAATGGERPGGGEKVAVGAGARSEAGGRKKRVSFGPKVEYRMPADAVHGPQAPARAAAPRAAPLLAPAPAPASASAATPAAATQSSVPAPPASNIANGTRAAAPARTGQADGATAATSGSNDGSSSNGTLPTVQQLHQQPTGAADEQPVFVFSVEHAVTAAAGEEGGGEQGGPEGGPVLGLGTLRLASDGGVVKAAGAGAGGAEVAAARVLEHTGREEDEEDGEEGEGLTDAALAASMQEVAAPSQPAIPRALRLWFPPEAGGIGVRRRQPPSTSTSTTAAGSSSNAMTSNGSRHTPRGAATRLPAASPSPSSTAAASSTLRGEVPANQAAASSPSASSSAPSASNTTTSKLRGEAAANQAVAAASPSASPSTSATTATSKLRKFLPAAPPRRHTVFLDKLPPGGSPGAQQPAPPAPATSAHLHPTPFPLASNHSSGNGFLPSTSNVASAAANNASPTSLTQDSHGSTAGPAQTHGSATSPAQTHGSAAPRPLAATVSILPPQRIVGVEEGPTPPRPVHVVHVPSGKRPPGGGVPIPPEAQPYFSDEEDDEDEEYGRGGRRGGEDEWHDDRDADEVADDLYAGTLRGVDEEEEEEEEDEGHGEEAGVGRGGRGGGAVGGPGGRVRVEEGRSEAERERPQGAGGVIVVGDGKKGRGRGGGGEGAGGVKAEGAGAGGRSRPERSAGSREGGGSAREAEGQGAAGGGSGRMSAWREMRLKEQQEREQQQESRAGERERRGLSSATGPCVSEGEGARAPSGGTVGSSGGGSGAAGVAQGGQQGEGKNPCGSATPSGLCDAGGHDQDVCHGGGVGGGPVAAPVGAGNGARGGVRGGGAAGGPGEEQEQQAEEEEDEDDLSWLRDDLDESGSASGADDGASSDDDVNYKSMLPFFQRATAHYHTVLTPFNQVHLALVGWVNSRTVAFVCGVGLGPLHSPGPALPDAAYADEGPEGSPAPPVVQSRGVLCRLLAAPLRTACVDLRVRAPQSDVDRKATALLSTFRLSGPIPGLKPPQWQLLALALLHALAVHHVPALRSALYTDPAAVTTPTASSADGPRGSEASSSDLGDAGEGQGQGEQGRRQGQVALRAGGVHASTCHPRLRDMLQRIGFDVHYLGALVDLMCSPDL